MFHYAEGVTLESTEDYVEGMRIEEQGHKTIQKVHDRHFGEKRFRTTFAQRGEGFTLGHSRYLLVIVPCARLQATARFL